MGFRLAEYADFPEMKLDDQIVKEVPSRLDEVKPEMILGRIASKKLGSELNVQSSPRNYAARNV